MGSSPAAAKSKPAQTAEQAYRSLVSGKLVEAVAQYSEAIESRELGPDMLANALLNRALAYQNMGQHAEAVDDYSAAMRVDAMGPRLRAVALYNRGISNQKLDKPAQSIEDFTNALFLDPEFSQAYYSRGNVLRESGQYLFALSDYEKALKYDHPEPHLPLYGTALTYEDLMRPQQAQKSLIQALALKPDFGAARIKLSSLLNGESGAADTPVAKAPAGSSAGIVLANDQIITGSVSGDGADLVMRKKHLPVPVSPPSALMAKTNLAVDTPDAERKTSGNKIVAKLPQEELKIAPAKAPPPNVTNTVSANGSGTLQGWTVQVSSQLSEDAAWKVWTKLQSKHKRLLKGEDPMVVKADLGKKGIFYRLRVHKLETKRAAAKLCSRLKRGGTACFVSRASS